MLPTPDNASLLLAVAKFLDTEVRPKVDAATAYRLRISGHTLETIAREISAGDAHEVAELERLEALLGVTGAEPKSAAERRAHIVALDQQLVACIQSEKGDAEDPRVAEHLYRTLVDRLAIDQPRFDARLDVEDKR